MLITASVLPTACTIFHCSNKEIAGSIPAQGITTVQLPGQGTLPHVYHHDSNTREMEDLEPHWSLGPRRNALCPSPVKSNNVRSS